MRVLLTAGQPGDNPRLLPLLDGIRVRQPGTGRPDRSPACDAELSLNPLKQSCGLATRCAKRMVYHQSELTIVAVVLWLRWHV